MRINTFVVLAASLVCASLSACGPVAEDLDDSTQQGANFEVTNQALGTCTLIKAVGPNSVTYPYSFFWGYYAEATATGTASVCQSACTTWGNSFTKLNATYPNHKFGFATSNNIHTCALAWRPPGATI